MSGLTLKTAKIDGNKRTIIAGMITGIAGPGIEAVEGAGFTVAYTGVGRYTLTFDDEHTALVAAVAGITSETPGDTKGDLVNFDTYDAATKTLEIDYWQGGAAHELLATEYISFVLVFRDGTVTT